MPVIKLPVSAFGPELLAVLIKGSREEVTITLDSPQQARSFQHRLHQLRTAMQRENHEHKDVVYRAKTSREDGGNVVKISPRDAEFKKAVESAGIDFDSIKKAGTLLEPPAPPSEPPTTLPLPPHYPALPPSESEIDDFLAGSPIADDLKRHRGEN